MKFFRRKRHKIGLALGSGAARGLAHIGVLKALKEKNISIDMLAGSSMGALVGAYFANYGDIKGLEETVLSMNFKDLLKLVDPNFPLLLKGLVSGNKVEEFLKTIIGDIEFKDLKVPFFIVATDIETGKEVIMKTGPVVKAVRASISIPAIFTPVKLKNKFLIDGGIVNPVPVNILKKEGMDFIIASNVIKTPRVRARINKEKTPRIKEENFNVQKDAPSIFETIIGAIYTMEYRIAQLQTKEANLAICSDVDYIGALEFYRAEEAIKTGYEKTKEIIGSGLRI